MKKTNLTIDEFLTALKHQVRDCAFGDLKDDMVLYALTLGLDNDRTRRRLFETKKLTLDKAVNLCRLTEDTETEMRKMKVNEEVSAVYKMKAKTRTHVKTPASKSQGPTYNQAEHKCNKCGRKHLPASHRDQPTTRQNTCVTNVDVNIRRDNAERSERNVSFVRRQISLQMLQSANRKNFKASLHGRGGRQ